MNDKNIEHFLESVNSDLSEAKGLVSNLEDYQRPDFDETELMFNEKKNFDEILLNDYIKKAILEVQFVLEYLNLEAFLKEFNSQLSDFENEFIRFNYIPYVGVLTNPVVDSILKLCRCNNLYSSE